MPVLYQNETRLTRHLPRLIPFSRLAVSAAVQIDHKARRARRGSIRESRFSVNAQMATSLRLLMFQPANRAVRSPYSRISDSGLHAQQPTHDTPTFYDFERRLSFVPLAIFFPSVDLSRRVTTVLLVRSYSPVRPRCTRNVVKRHERIANWPTDEFAMNVRARARAHTHAHTHTHTRTHARTCIHVHIGRVIDGSGSERPAGETESVGVGQSRRAAVAAVAAVVRRVAIFFGVDCRTRKHLSSAATVEAIQSREKFDDSVRSVVGFGFLHDSHATTPEVRECDTRTVAELLARKFRRRELWPRLSIPEALSRFRSLPPPIRPPPPRPLHPPFVPSSRRLCLTRSALRDLAPCSLLPSARSRPEIVRTTAACHLRRRAAGCVCNRRRRAWR